MNAREIGWAGRGGAVHAGEIQRAVRMGDEVSEPGRANESIRQRFVNDSRVL